MNKPLVLAMIVLSAWALPAQAAKPEGKPFPNIVWAETGAPPEGFTIGKGSTAYNGSLDGSIYKMDLRTGQGESFVDPEPGADVANGDCYKLGMRVDPRSNYLFVAGCYWGNAYVFDADSGEPIMEYQVTPVEESVLNDIAITQDAVYLTDFAQPAIYRLPLSKNGGIPGNPDAATPIPLTGDFDAGENLIGAYANGIVATPDGKTLIIGNSGSSKIFRVDPATGHADEIIVDPPLLGLVDTGEVDEDGFPVLDGTFQDAIVLRGHVLYVLSSGWNTTEDDMVQVVVLDDEMLTGTRVGAITDDELDGPASGALHGNSLYVNNGRYFNYPGCEPDEPCTEYWITKLNIHDIH